MWPYSHADARIFSVIKIGVFSSMSDSLTTLKTVISDKIDKAVSKISLNQ